MIDWDKLPQATVEQGLLSAALRGPNGLQSIILSGLTVDSFVSCGDVYTFIREYTEKYRAQPTDSVIKAQRSDWAPPDGEFAYWLEVMRDYVFARKAHRAVQDALQNFSEPRLAVQHLVQALGGISAVGVEHIATTDGSVALSLEKFNMRTQYFEDYPDAIHGVTTTFSSINRTRVGWIGGELVGLFARPTVGKSWKLVDEAVCAWFQGCRVLFVTPEMPVNHIALRIYTFMAKRMGIPFSHRLAYQGNAALKPAFERLAAELVGSERFWSVDSYDGRPVGLADLERLTLQFQPDVVCIDGISLMYNEKNLKAGWEEMKYNSYGLKNFATRHDLPIVVTHQAVNASRGNKDKDNQMGMAAGRGDDFRMPTLNDSAYGDSFVQACSTVITMCPDAQRSDLRWYSVRKCREREFEEIGQRLPMYWDVDSGTVVDMSHHKQDVAAVLLEVSKMTGGRK